MKCPECEKPMVWSNDEELDETTFYSEYHCYKCNIDVWKYYTVEGVQNE